MALLKANTRTATGTRKARSLRAGGKIPGVIYGHGEATLAVTLDKHEVDLAIGHGERLLEIDIEGTMQNVLVKDVQYDHMGSDILHVDLTRVNLDELVEVTVPIVLRGTPAGAIEGGVLNQVVAQVSVEVQVRSIPDDIRTTVDHMKIGDKLFMKDLHLPEGAKLKDDPEMLIATVSFVAEEVVAATEEQVAAPEVIGAKKEEEGEAGAAPAEEKEKKKE
jgi:large subunit ribosomal protein L25